MDTPEILRVCDKYLAEAGIDAEIERGNFLDYAELVKNVIGEWPQKRKSTEPRLRDFVEGLRALRDGFEGEAQRDPMILYRPAHHVALEFHQSTAFIRQFRGGNRISKTESACYDHYAVLTGQMRYRPPPPLPSAAFIVGVDYSNYAPEVFEKKYISGEAGNPLSPVFPEGGKWLHHYDIKRHIAFICCPECAAAGKTQSCKHPLSTLHLFTDQARQKEQALAGGQYAQGQFDEHIQEMYFTEAITRLESVPRSSLMITYTPVHGKGAWEHQKLTRLYEKGPPENYIPGTERLYVSLHTIDQFSAGLAAPELIEAKMKVMVPAEVEARVWGRPAAFSKTAVFDAWEISEMYDETRAGEKGFLFIPPKSTSIYESVQESEEENLTEKEQSALLMDSGPDTEITFVSSESAFLEVWEPPQKEAQYIVGADVAKGLRDCDYSCAEILKIEQRNTDFYLTQVAEYHGWVNPEPYGDDCMRTAMWYNNALLVVERRGPGDRTLQRLKELGYWNLFRDLSDPSTAMYSPDACLGIDTNVKSKSIIVSVLQQKIKDRVTGKRTIIIRSYQALEELGHYGQEKTEGGNYKFRGEGGYNDDRVMGLALPAYALAAQPELYDVAREARRQQLARKKAGVSEHDRFWQDVRRQQKEFEDELRYPDG